MANIRFRVRGKRDNSPVYIRYNESSENRIELKTGYYCNPKYFNNETGKVRNIAEFTDKETLRGNLRTLEDAILKTINKTSSRNKEWLQTEINRHHGIKPESEKRFTLVEMFETYIEYKKYSAVNTVTESTIKSYNATKSRLESFQEHFKPERIYFIDEIGSDFKDEFVKWANSIAKYQPETFKKSLKHFKTICRYAKTKKRIKIDDSLFERETGNNKQKQQDDEVFPHLSIDDIYTLRKLSGADHIENARDWLIISCWTGCRVSDLMELSVDKIVLTIKGERAIKYTQIKTGITVEIPLHNHVENIIANRDRKSVV